jgi:AcrR family transcriptional regulator
MNPASTRRRARAKENLRRSILDAARELFAQEDYHAISMRRIADKIEYSPTAIYLHFTDKEEILFCLVEEGFSLLNGHLTSIAIKDPVERLRIGGRAYFDFAFSNPHYYRIMFQLEDKGMLVRYHEKLHLAPACFNFICQAVIQAREQGQFVTSHSVEAVSHTIWASLHGAVTLTLSGHIEKLPQEFRAEFYETVIENTLDGQRVRS